MISLSLYYFHRFIYLLLFARAIMSWVVMANRNVRNPLVILLYDMTEPILYPMRALFDRLGLNRGMIDFSFLATLFALEIIFKYLISFCLRMGL